MRVLLLLEMKTLYCMLCGWKELCASRARAILEFLVISRQLLQLEIASRSFAKQMFHTVGNTQAQTKENSRLDSVFSNDSLHHVYRQHYIPFHVYAAAPGYGQDIPCLIVLLVFVVLTGLCKDFASLSCPHVAAALMQVKSIRWVSLWFPGTSSAELGF